MRSRSGHLPGPLRHTHKPDVNFIQSVTQQIFTACYTVYQALHETLGKRSKQKLKMLALVELTFQ